MEINLRRRNAEQYGVWVGHSSKALLGVGVVLWGLTTAEPVLGAGQKNPPHIVTRFSAAPPNGAKGLCQKYIWACERRNAARPEPVGSLKLARKVNSHINRTVRSIDDNRQYGRREYWSLPTRRGGDCEDFALLKKAELIRRGFAADNLLIATVLDTRQFNHAVLVLRTEAGDYVLDNLTDRIRLWSDTRYSFLKIQDPKAPHLWKAVLAGGAFN